MKAFCGAADNIKARAKVAGHPHPPFVKPTPPKASLAAAMPANVEQ